MNIKELATAWLDAKHEEALATKKRRDLEDEMTQFYELVEQHEGTTTKKDDGYKITISQRINRRINGDKLQDLAAEHDLIDYLSQLFRWKPDINMTEWKRTDPSITAKLAEAITASAGRPSYKIELLEK